VRAVNRLDLPSSTAPGPGGCGRWGHSRSRQQDPQPRLLLLILVIAGFVVQPVAVMLLGQQLRRVPQLGLVVIGIRVVAAGAAVDPLAGQPLLFTLPQIPLPDWAKRREARRRRHRRGSTDRPVRRWASSRSCCVASARPMRSPPGRLLKSLPGALYEMGVACVVALTFAPQLVTDARRIRAADVYAAVTRGLLPTTAMPSWKALRQVRRAGPAMTPVAMAKPHTSPTPRRITGGAVLLGCWGSLWVSTRC